MKKICVIDRTNIKLHPPVMSLLDSLSEGYRITIISSEYEKSILDRYPTFNFTDPDVILPHNKFFRNLAFRKRCKKVLKEYFDLIWIATADTALWMGDMLKNKYYVINLFELYDKHPRYLKRLKCVVKNAKKVIVPEYNRAHIIRTWFELKETPVVIPNKFSDMVLNKRMGLENVDYKIPLDDKFIIYQGIASRERNLDALCKAVKKIENYKLVMMCAESDYLRELMKKYDFIIHQPFVTPPYHLAITSYAYIGIVTYQHYSLNTIFCAPNKIWEYSSMGLPMIANSIPGLHDTVERYNAGVCVEMDSVDEIIKGIKKISSNYASYVQGTKRLFDSVNIRETYKNLFNSLLNE